MKEEHTQEVFEASVQEEVHIRTEGTDTVRPVSEKISIFEKIALWLLFGVVFLLPIFFLPVQGLALGFSKNLLFSSAVILSTIFMLMSWLQKGSLSLPRSSIFGALGFIAIFSLFASFMSAAFRASFFGGGAETATSFQFLILGLSVFLFAVFFRNRERIFLIFTALFFSTIIVFVFQFFNLFFSKLAVLLGFSGDKLANLVGSWSDFGIFSGLAAILSLISIEIMPRISVRLRNTFFVILFLAFFFHILAVYTYSWITLAFASFILSVFLVFRRIAQGGEEIRLRLFSVSLTAAVIASVFAFVGTPINAKLFEVLHIPPIQDVRPSLSGTYMTAIGALTPVGKESLVGVGPNRFFIAWQQHRPKEVNYTPWWGVDFNEGFGTIPSFLITSGVLGFAAWVVFLLLFFVGGFLALKKQIDGMTPFVQYITISSFAGASYLWIVAVTNTVGIVPFSLAFIFTGIFLGLLAQEGVNTVSEYNYLHNPRKGFVIVTILLVLLGAATTLVYKVITRTQSVFAYRAALLATSQGDVGTAETAFVKSLRLYEGDEYYRSFSIFNSYQAQELIARKDISPDDLRSQFALRFQTSIESANKAVALDGENYLNWVALGNAYAVLAPLRIEGISSESYTQAKTAYKEAAKHNPFNPQIPYMLAELALAGGHTDEAQKFIEESLALKSDYADALVLLSQIEESQGHTPQALAVLENANTDFSDPKILFQIGYLRYKNGKYKDAAAILEKTLQAIPDYSNAKYFLGLSYFEIGRTNDAIKEFTDIERLNSGRSDITQIIHNLQNGYAPLSVPAPDKAPALIDVGTTTKKSDFSAN